MPKRHGPTTTLSSAVSTAPALSTPVMLVVTSSTTWLIPTAQTKPMPLNKLGLPLNQEETAAWLDCSVEEMNELHDDLHRSVEEWTGQHSFSLEIAQNNSVLPLACHELAALEEDAVLYLQRYI